MNKKIPRILEISIENFGPFKEREALSFQAEIKKSDDNYSECIEINQREKYYFNNSIAIFGPNASGKSKFFEAITLYSNLFKIESNINMFTFNILSNFNNLREPIKFENLFTDFEKTYIHKLEIFIDYKNIKPNKLMMNEMISDITNEKKVLWKSENIEFNQANLFLNMINYEIIKERSLKNSLASNIVNTTTTIQKAHKDVFNTLSLVLDEIFIYNVSNLSSKDFQSSSLLFENLTYLYNKIKDIKEIEQILLKILQAIDNNIQKVELIAENIMNNNLSSSQAQTKRKMIVLKKLKTKNNDHLYIDSLSDGTINFVNIVLWLISINYHSNNHKYIFIDELGQSWHINLSKILVNLFQNKLFKNSTFIFTSHHPEVADKMKKDSIYIIQRNHKLKRVSDYIDPKTGQKIRKEFKFSKNYPDEALDVFSSTPDQQNIYNIYELFLND